jgi:hypothetical protein
VASLTPQHRAAQRVRLIAELLARIAIASESRPLLQSDVWPTTTTVTPSTDPDPRGDGTEPAVPSRSLI